MVMGSKGTIKFECSLSVESLLEEFWAINIM